MEVTVGAFMFMVLLALGLFTIVLSRENLFRRTYTLNIVFDSVMGLREGDNVFVRGVDIGKIKLLRLQPDGVHITASLDKELVLREDYRIEILPSSVLGGRYLNISEGTESRPPLPAGQEVRGTSPVDLIDEATRTVQSVRTSLNEGGILTNLEAIAVQFRQITTQLSQGQGTLGRLLMDDKVYKDIETMTANLKAVSTDLEEGRGTIGKLLRDEKVYDDIADIAKNLKTVSQNLADGKGTLGKLLGEDDRLYNDLSSAVASLKRIADSVEQGKGTIGKLVKDDALYDDTKALINEARAAVDDFRETSPITTFSSVFFGAF